jgi:hypothetical protein
MNNIIRKEDRTRLYFIKRNNPAVTRVLLCTKALTGVGAAIALGSHLLKGNCALLVNLVTTKIKKRAGIIKVEEKMRHPLKNNDATNQKRQ